MTALVKYTDAVLIQSSETWEGVGTNFRDNRSQWFNINDAGISLSAGAFTIPPSTHVANSDWVRDAGPNTIDASLQEKRAFCLKGAVTINFTGTTLVLRVNTDWGWGNAHKVYIDGVQPSTIGGIQGYANTVSCDSAGYGLEGPGYADVMVADGLSNGPHTCVVYANGTGEGYFAIAGFKTYSFASNALVKATAWIVPSATKLPQNMQTLSMINKGVNTVLNATLSYPAGLLDGNANALVAGSVGSLTGINPLTQVVMPAFNGDESSGQRTYPLTLSALYADPAGTVSMPATASIGPSSPTLTIGGSTWAVDNAAPGGVKRIYSKANPGTINYLQFTFTGDALTMTVQQDFGYGVLGIYDSTGTTLLGSVTCNAQQTQLFTTTITGFGAGSHTVRLKKTTTDTSKYVIFVSASWTTTSNYSQITETVNLVMNAQQPYALQPVNVGSDGYSLTYDPPVPGATDSSGSTVRQNSNLAYTEVLERFPTYAVCYQPGYSDILSQYDILIVDPFAAKTADVLAWQAMGIEVYGYISIGEEDGFYVNRYDFLSANAPYRGDGTGPGGNAGYYMKGGYQGRECTECTFDNQAVAGTKSCAQAQPMYFMGTGRCGSACSYDSLNGYTTFAAGGACGAGFTSANKWIRPDANTACTNATCPSYKPIHQLQTGTKCPKYEQADAGYMQDFSIANPGTPDQNGVWAAYYADAGDASWLDRIMSYYAPTVIGGPVVVANEVVTVKAATIAAGAVLVFDTAQFPIDPDATITLTTLDGVTGVYRKNLDYTLDMKTGAFVFNVGIAPAVTAGQQLKISYTKKGHHMNGIFMDTPDDADVYPLMGDAMAALVNNLKARTGTKLISNRGFSNLNKYIQSCSGVMFESWLTGWNENTGAYFKLTDPDSMQFDKEVNDQLRELRMKHVFDVYSLNYCNADASGDELRAYCSTEDRKKGYLSWTSTIALNSPAPNIVVDTPSQKITTNAFKRYRIKRY
jgi:hypothetical protein